ncbi:MAG TPA: hypothetical protein VHE81_14430, partial [Lacipirellulaceae bacterium]|nr:hypothetical protein [Lacipirellulaceae bacterium]
MAGKLQLAAKCLLGTTLLASGGGGFYYASTHGWMLPGSSHHTNQPKASDLDAVASAWAESPSNHVTDDSQSSPIARSAQTLPVHSDDPVVKPASDDDRYAMPAVSSLPTAVAVDDTPKKVAPKLKKKAAPKSAQKSDARQVRLASHTEPAHAEHEPTLAVAESASDTPLARGQEPKDDLPPPAQATSAAANSGKRSGSISKREVPANGGPLKEPQPLKVADQTSDIADAANRAKQAFRAAPPSAINDRYAQASPPIHEPAMAATAATANPFAATPVSTSPSNAATSKNDRIEPLPAAPDDAGGRLNTLQANDNGLRPLDSPPTARVGNRNPGVKERSPQTAPFDSPRGSDADFSPSPSPRSSSLGGPSEVPGQSPGTDGVGKPGEKALEGPQQPTLVIQKFAPGEIQVGKPAKFVLQIRNAGTQVADNVTIQDEVPQGTQLISTSPSANNNSGHLSWLLGKLSPGEDRTIEVQVMPKSEGDIGSVATVTYSSQASAKTHCTMPQLAIRMTAPSEVMIGAQQHVKIEVRNPGSGDATGVMLFENVPPNMKHVAGPALEFEIGTLRAGENRELDLVLTAEKAGKVTNVISARADGNLQVQQQVQFEVIAPALSVAV